MLVGAELYHDPDALVRGDREEVERLAGFYRSRRLGPLRPLERVVELTPPSWAKATSADAWTRANHFRSD